MARYQGKHEYLDLIIFGACNNAYGFAVSFTLTVTNIAALYTDHLSMTWMFPAPRVQPDYIPLASEIEGCNRPDATSPRSKAQTAPFWIMIVVGISVAISILSLSVKSPLPLSLHLAPASDRPIRRLSQYVNLSKIKGDSTERLGPKFSYAQVVMQIEASDAERRTVREDTRQYATQVGTVFPDDRHIVVSKKMSTVVQFRASDFDFERCMIGARLPIPSRLLDPTIDILSASQVDIWLLHGQEEISPYVPHTWQSVPQRQKFFGNLVFGDNFTWTSAEFFCPPGSFFAFELRCNDESPECHVDFWQNRESPHGIFLKQFAPTIDD